MPEASQISPVAFFLAWGRIIKNPKNYFMPRLTFNYGCVRRVHLPISINEPAMEKERKKLITVNKTWNTMTNPTSRSHVLCDVVKMCGKINSGAIVYSQKSKAVCEVL